MIRAVGSESLWAFVRAVLATNIQESDRAIVVDGKTKALVPQAQQKPETTEWSLTAKQWVPSAGSTLEGRKRREGKREGGRE